jgi:hypothetical protein
MQRTIGWPIAVLRLRRMSFLALREVIQRVDAELARPPCGTGKSSNRCHPDAPAARPRRGNRSKTEPASRRRDNARSREPQLDQSANLFDDLRSAAAWPGSPAPIETEAGPVPAVSGLTSTRISVQGGQQRRSVVQNNRSKAFNCGRGRFRFNTAICCRRATTSRAVSLRRFHCDLWPGVW